MLTRVNRLTTRRASWLTLLIGLLVAFGVMGALRGAQQPPTGEAVPAASESARVAERLASMPGHDVQPVVLVVTRADGAPLGPPDLAAATALGARLPAPEGHRASPAVPSQDRAAAIVQVPVRVDASSAVNVGTIDDLRERIDAAKPAGQLVRVTGGPAFGADIAKAFEGANVTLLLVTIGIVALLLLFTYRSPVLWLIPLLVVGLADQVAAAVTAALGEGLGLGFDAGIVSVLVFGAGTNYSLLLISRYREELHRRADHRAALAEAWRHTAPAIVAGNLTVVVALAGLLFASIPSTRGLGIASAVGLLIAVVAVLTLLPAALAICGRRVFWPFVPRPGADRGPRDGIFAGIAGGVLRRPAAVVAASLALLGVLSVGLLGTRVGLDQRERFTSVTESAAGLEVLGEHFPAGAAQPLLVVTDDGHAPAVASAARTVEGVGSVEGTAPGDPVVRVITQAEPGSEESRDVVRRVRAAVHAVPDANALVGGAEAAEVDAREGNEADLRLIVPLVLGVTALVLLVLLRSVTAVLLLLPVNALSAIASIGAGSWIGRQLLGWPALDLQVPLFAFLFLVALGIDYTIFLSHRARTEAVAHGTRAGMVRAVGATGAVITSAGIVLAAVFAALSVLPLVTLGQLGLIVGIGVLIDTTVVRTLLVPGIAGLVGERLWWPGRLG